VLLGGTGDNYAALMSWVAGSWRIASSNGATPS